MSEIKLAYKKIYWSLMIWAFLSIFFMTVYPQRVLGIILFAAILTLGLYIFSHAIKIIFLLPTKIPLIPFCAGIFLVLGGAIFDVINTVIHSPNLSSEANIFIRFLFDQSFSLPQIYCIGIVGQVLYVSNICALWAMFLKAYPLMIQEILPGNVLSTIAIILGGPNANLWKLLIGKVDYFFSISSITPLLVGLSCYRWYLGLEWLNLAPISRILVPTIFSIISLFIYLYVSFRLIKKESFNK